MRDRKFAWTLETEKSAKDFNIDLRRIKKMSKEAIKKQIITIDEGKWNAERLEKSSLELYNSWKTKIEEVKEYDNTYSSVLWYQARINTLPLNDRKRFTNEETKCEMCEEPTENLQHFILECTKLSEIRQADIKLQRPHIQNMKDLLGDFLFTDHNADETKETLFKLWKKREKLRKTDTTN